MSFSDLAAWNKTIFSSAVLALLVAACSSDPGSGTPRDYGEIGGPDGTELATEQVLHKGNGAEPQTLDPHKAQGVPAGNILRDVFEPLVMEADIQEIPPRAITLENAAPVVLTDPAQPGQSSTLQTAGHWMCPLPFPPPGVPCPVPCSNTPYPVCADGDCPTDEICVPEPEGFCRCVPLFPPAGFDLSPTTGIFRVDVFGVGPVDTSGTN